MHPINHPKVKPFTRDIGSALAIDPTFIDFVFAKKRPECFRYWVEDVDSGWTCYIPAEFNVAYPLWCTNADQTLLLVRESTVSFGKGWHDNPEMEIISQTTQGLLTNLIAELADAGESDSELKQAADFCGYQFLDELLSVMDNAQDSSWSEILQRFIAEVDLKSR